MFPVPLVCPFVVVPLVFSYVYVLSLNKYNSYRQDVKSIEHTIAGNEQFFVFFNTTCILPSYDYIYLTLFMIHTFIRTNYITIDFEIATLFQCLRI
jgi:hypothetical protein